MFNKIIKSPVTYILIFSFILRVVMIKYGLPFWVYNDEQPFVLASLKMMQLKPLLPALHEADFTPFLYYPPYISYIFLPFFVLVAVISLLFFPGSLADFQASIASDPSIFFLTGRFITILFSLVTIYLFYRIVKNLTANNYAAILSGIISASSLMHISLSITGKHWMFILLFYTIALYILSKPGWSLRKRLLGSAVVTGIGIGVSTVVILFSLIMVFWYLFVEKKSLKDLFLEKDMYISAGMIVIFFFIPIILYPASLGFAPDMTTHDPKTFLGYITFPFIFVKTFLSTEPVLTLLFLTGLVMSIKKYKNIFIPFISFTIIYSLVFYQFFRWEYRFLLPLLLILIIGAGLGIREINERLPKKIFLSLSIFLIVISIVFSTRLSLLGYRNDSRVQAKEWIETYAKSDEKILVYANLMRLPNSESGIREQEFIDPKSLRTNDRSEISLDPKYRNDKIFHVLNLYTVENDNFYNSITEYAKSQGYKYLVISKDDFLNKPAQHSKVYNLSNNGKLVARFGNSIGSYSLGKTEIGPTLLPLWQIKELGPEIEIYKLNF